MPLASPRKIAHFANTIIGRPGNIGVRTNKIIQQHDRQGGNGYCICRLADEHAPGYTYVEMGWMGHIPRLLNAVNIYLSPTFDHRKWDLKLFERHCVQHLNAITADHIQVAHVWDACVTTLHRLRQCGIPVILDVPIAPFHYVQRLHAQGMGQGLKFFERQMRLEQEAFSLADTLLAPSAFVAQELELAGVPAEKIRVIEFGTHVPERTRRHSPDKRGIDFAFVGIINRRKGVHDLLSVWQDPAFSSDRLHLCGRMTPVIAQCLGKTRSSNVLVPGFINPFEYLLACDVFVFPSWSEGSAKAVYEAMACGLPVITTHSSGSVVRHGIDGFVIDAGDQQALRQYMEWFHANPQQIETMGAAARARVQGLTWTRYAERVIDIYNEVAA